MSGDGMQLGAMQRWMLEALIKPGKQDPSTLEKILLPGPMLNVAACLAIYQRSYVLRLRKCLQEQFPATRFALGSALFDDFADEYLRDCPSDSYTLYELGRRFPDWLEQTRPDRQLPEQEREHWINFMVDLAHYERQLFRLFDAPGNEGLAWPGHETDDDSLGLQPELVLAQYRYPVAWFYHEVRAGRAPELPAQALQHYAIARRDYHTTTYPVSALHFRFLGTVRRLGRIGLALEDIAAQAQRPLDTITQSWAMEVRRPWIEAGFFIQRPPPDVLIMQTETTGAPL